MLFALANRLWARSPCRQGSADIFILFCYIVVFSGFLNLWSLPFSALRSVSKGLLPAFPAPNDPEASVEGSGKLSCFS